MQVKGGLLSQHVSVVEGHFLKKYLDLTYRNTLADQLQIVSGFYVGAGVRRQFFPCTGLSVSEAPRSCGNFAAIVSFFAKRLLSGIFQEDVQTPQ